MDWPSYVQKMLSGGHQQQSLTGGDPGPILLMALQRFLAENNYAVNMARQGAKIMNDIAAQQAAQVAAPLQNIPLLGGMTGAVAGNNVMGNAQAAGDMMIAQAGGTLAPMAGWDAIRYPEQGMVMPAGDMAGWETIRQAIESGVIPGSGVAPGWESGWSGI